MTNKRFRAITIRVEINQLDEGCLMLAVNVIAHGPGGRAGRRADTGTISLCYRDIRQINTTILQNGG